MFLVGKNT